MKGLELARRFYEEVGLPALEAQCGDLLPYVAVGLAGSGSECYGYDDELSRDHDFEPGFCLFLPDESVVDRRSAFALERAYAKLPSEFLGFRRAALSPVGGNRHGVIRTGDFFAAKTGCRDGALSVRQWLAVPEYALAEAVNGAVFCDPYGEFTAIREKLRQYPADVRQKKLAGYLLLMGQAGQYNYLRCVRRGEREAAQLALVEFVTGAMHVAFLLAGRYMPYYKWSFRALRELSAADASLADSLSFLLTGDNEAQTAQHKSGTVEQVCGLLAQRVREQGLTSVADTEMERLAYAVNDGVGDPQLRNSHILCGV